MEFSELIKRRESCRDYDETKKVSREDLTAMVEAARLCPSACNSQPWHLVVVDTPELASKMAGFLHVKEWGTNIHTHQVPAFIIVTEETPAKLRPRIEERFGSQHFAQLDIGGVTAYLTLKAADLSLSTCIMGVFQEEEIKAMLSIPEEFKIRLIVSVGYAKTPKIREKIRKDMAEIVTYK